jgi:hypothetical protein
VSDGSDDLIVGRAVAKTAAGLPERIVIVDEGDQIAPAFTAVQGPLPLRFETLEQGLGLLKPLITSRRPPSPLLSASRKSRTESRPKNTVSLPSNTDAFWPIMNSSCHSRSRLK